MQRRSFIRNTALSAVAISATGFIRFNGENYEGDCETTTDILGPFYRPEAPLRTNMRIINAKGQPIVLSGVIKHKDCKTPLKNACVELWHCDGDGVYDNDSPAFNYRAKAYCDEQGKYSFETILPVPYDVGNGNIRPAHFHMMISAEGYQSLITQLYFNGDKYIAKDTWASSPAAQKRILTIANRNSGEKSVTFNVTMMDKIPADVAVIERLAGKYADATTKEVKATFYRRDNLLWVKDAESINGGYPLQYEGNNTFIPYGSSPFSAVFVPQSDGSVKITFIQKVKDKSNIIWEAVKEK